LRYREPIPERHRQLFNIEYSNALNLAVCKRYAFDICKPTTIPIAALFCITCNCVKHPLGLREPFSNGFAITYKVPLTFVIWDCYNFLLAHFLSLRLCHTFSVFYPLHISKQLYNALTNAHFVRELELQLYALEYSDALRVSMHKLNSITLGKPINYILCLWLSVANALEVHLPFPLAVKVPYAIPHWNPLSLNIVQLHCLSVHQ
jgi:hypothetical protein